MNRDSHAKERRLRRRALQIAELLPEDEAEALLVVGYTKELIERYLLSRENACHARPRLLKSTSQDGS